MCNPMLAVAAVTGGSSLVSGIGQRSVLKQTNEIKKGIAKQNEANAIEAAARSNEQIMLRRRQEQFAAGQQARKTRIQAHLAKGEFGAGTAAAGVEGRSIEDQQLDFDLQEALAMSAIKKQDEMNTQAAGQQMEAVTVQTQNRINAAQPQLQAIPTLLGIGLNALGAAAGGYVLGGQMTSGAQTNPLTGSALDGVNP